MDQWLVKEGRWIRPRNVALAANAFGDKIGKSGVRVARRFDENFFNKPTQQSTLLNRAKTMNRSGTTTLPKFMFGRTTKMTTSMPTVVVPADIEMSAVVIQKHVRARIRQASSASKAGGGKPAAPDGAAPGAAYVVVADVEDGVPATAANPSGVRSPQPSPH